MTCQSTGRPATGCSDLGRRDLRRLPFPAAMTTTARLREGLAKRNAPGEGNPLYPPPPDARKGEPARRCPGGPPFRSGLDEALGDLVDLVAVQGDPQRGVRLHHRLGVGPLGETVRLAVRGPVDVVGLDPEVVGARPHPSA